MLIRDWPEIRKSKIQPSEFCPIFRDWGKLVMPNLVKSYWMLTKVTECCKMSRLQLLLLKNVFTLKVVPHKKCFLNRPKSSFCSWDIQIFVIFPFLSTISRFKRTNGSLIFMMSWIGIHKFAYVNFGTTQKPRYITSSNVAR